MLIDMSKSEVKPKNILYTLQNRDIHNVSTMKTIYNACYKYKVVEQADRSQIQQLMSKLNEHNYIEWHQSQEDIDCITDLFWAHRSTFELLQAFPRVLIMDCTYKTNKYRYPLLEIVTVTSTNLTFYVGITLFQFECEDNYVWALERLKKIMEDKMLSSVIVTVRELVLMNAIKKIFPTTINFLCRWHISKNILANCRKLFKTAKDWEDFICSWNSLVSSCTKQQYMQNLSAIESDFSGYQGAFDYVKHGWLDKYKENFVAAWSNLVMHFGNVTSNRAETTHAKLKRQLGSSLGTFVTLWDKIHVLLELQHTEIKASFEKSKTIVQHKFTHFLFKELMGFISRHTLDIILEESERVDTVDLDPSACECIVRHMHVCPCAHEIAEYKREGRPIPLFRLNSHWKKLDLVPSISDGSTKLSCIVEIEMIMKRFEQMDDSGKLQLKKKLMELVNPKSTHLVEPIVKAKA
ncbi:hypothetical protein Ddye_029690 [Dipteronia dyeriana]|uniref:MULE transposase domain-containing protein n=1 Tax=Dipteronia dyeriana TaxID=168575 RepID=A0AAD9TG04_9ROSI|nr:hypothetical protein Ddye_029690 [Dipteronia dyeriana]